MVASFSAQLNGLIMAGPLSGLANTPLASTLLPVDVFLHFLTLSLSFEPLGIGHNEVLGISTTGNHSNILRFSFEVYLGSGLGNSRDGEFSHDLSQ